MATKNIEKKTAIRIWRWISPGVNHPMDCAPSEWLLGRLSESFPEDQISDEIWRLARRALRLRFPGLDRPLGSCFYPGVANMLDVAYQYGRATQRVLRRVASAAAEIAHAGDGLWAVSEIPGDEYRPAGTLYTSPTARPKAAHIAECPWLIGQLAEAVREGRAPAVEEIRPQFFESGWTEARAEEARRDEEARQKLAPIAELLTELKVSLFETETPSLAASERWYDQYHCPNGRHTNSWVTDGRKVEVSSEVTERPHGYFGGGGRAELRIEGATYAFSVGFTPGFHRSHEGTESVRRVYVWPGFDPAEVAKALGRG